MSTRRLCALTMLAALGALPTRAQEAPLKDAPSEAHIRSLAEKLGARYLDERQQAAEALALIGAPAAPVLIEALGHDDFRMRRAACRLLGRIGAADAAPRLIALLEDPEESVREDARDALTRLGPPAHDAVRKARDAGTISAELAEAIIERPLKRTVEELLNKCITPNFGWGSYKDQFKDVVRLGPAAALPLLRLFTTPLADYEFDYGFEGEAQEENALEFRKQVVQRLAGSALADLKDPSVVPVLQSFLSGLGIEDPARVTDPRQDFYETAAFALMKLGDPEPFGRLRDALAKASGAELKDGALTVKPAEVGQPRAEQISALLRLAMVFSKVEDSASAERTYESILRFAPEHVRPHGVWYNLACSQALQGKRAEAVASLRKAVDFGYHDADWIRRDGDLDAIRKESGYLDVMSRFPQQRGVELPRFGN